METKLRLLTNFQNFEKLEQKLQQEKRFDIVHQLIDIGMSGFVGVYYSKALEQFLVDYSNQNVFVTEEMLAIKPEKNTVLHVMTEAYLHGGHTRIVERWIQNAPLHEKHQVILITQRELSQIPEKLKQVVQEKNGRIIILDLDASDLEKIHNIQINALQNELVVLHHHPQDYLPLMALGHQKIKRPVVCFNHSGHTFWIGSSIVDCCIDIEKNQHELTQSRRSVKEAVLINMPYDTLASKENKNRQVLLDLGIPMDAFVMCSMASIYKFTSIAGISFVNYLRTIFQFQQDIVFMGIGVDDSEEQWRILKEEFPSRVFLLGIVPHHLIQTYLANVDLYVDSFPFNSWVSLIDAINYGNSSVLTLKTPVGYPPFIENTFSVAQGLDQLLQKTKELYLDKELRVQVQHQLYEKYVIDCAPKVFANEISRLQTKVKNNFLTGEVFLKEINKNFSDFDFFNYEFRVALLEPVVMMKKKGFGLVKKITETIVEKKVDYYFFNYLILKKRKQKLFRKIL